MSEQMRKDLYTRVALQLLLFVPVAGVVLFLPAGTFDYWEAWLFAVVFFAGNVALTVYLIVKDPKLLARRMKAGPAAERPSTHGGCRIGSCRTCGNQVAVRVAG